MSRTRFAVKISDLRAQFPVFRNGVYLNTAAMAPGSLSVQRRYEEAVAAWGLSKFKFAEAERAAESSRQRFAKLIGASSDEIALVPAVSMAAGVIAAQFPPALAGQNVIVGDIEFSSNSFPWQLLAKKGYSVRMVRSEHGALPLEGYAAAADRGTRLIAVSAVQSATGYLSDLAGLASLAEEVGAWLFVDGAQAVGALDINVSRMRIDFLSVPSFKFMLGTKGMGYLYVRRERLPEIDPLLVGRRAARRPEDSLYGPAMELSETASKLDTSLVWFAAFSEPAALDLLEQHGLNDIWRRNHELTTYLYQRLLAEGLLQDPFPPEHRSTIVSMSVPNAESRMARLDERGIVVSLRAGRMRVSLHAFNSEDDTDRLVDALLVSR